MKLYYNEDKCPRCNELTDHSHGKVCSKCRNAQRKERYKEHAEERKEYMRNYYKTHRRVCIAYAIKSQSTRKEEIKEYMKCYAKEYHRNDRNSEGYTLSNIRHKSRTYLFNTLKQNKLPDYEIHHCFGYDDYTKFIYIPRSLHVKIHQYLRDNNIDSRTDHYREIVNLINECSEYTYIHV